MSRLNYLVRDPISFVGSRDARRQPLFVGVSLPCFIAVCTCACVRVCMRNMQEK